MSNSGTLRAAVIFVFAIAFAGAPATGQEEGEEGAFDFYKYAAHPATLSAVSAAASLLGPCPGPLQYSEFVQESYGTVELTVSCQFDDESEAAVILRFDILDHGYLLPKSFEYAG